MSKTPKRKSNGEEPTKLDMSFLDALRLAAKTPPLMEIRLSLNERKEIKNVAGRIISFKKVTLNKESERISLMQIKVEVNNGTSNINYSIAPTPNVTDRPILSHIGYTDYTVKINDEGKMYLTLVNSEGHQTVATSCTIEYTVGVNHPNE